ncbi:MAG: ABC transporter ATP-binding protein [Candidatus Thorarchaeota archaeon]
MLEADNLTKMFRLGNVPIRALQGVSFKVNHGEFVAILGPSGSGKTTLLNMIGVLDRPTRGRVLIENVDASLLSQNRLAELRRRVGFVFQFFNLINRLDALGNVELPLGIQTISKDERRVKAEKMLELVGLENRTNHKPNELSGGERQRVAIARALVTEPSYVLLDEPTGNLDTRTANDVMEIIVNLNTEHDVTLVLVTHDSKVSVTSQRTLSLVDGEIIADEVA